MADSVRFVLDDGASSETIKVQRTAKYVHLINGAGDRVSIPRELLPAVLATLKDE